MFVRETELEPRNSGSAFYGRARDSIDETERRRF